MDGLQRVAEQMHGNIEWREQNDIKPGQIRTWYNVVLKADYQWQQDQKKMQRLVERLRQLESCRDTVSKYLDCLGLTIGMAEQMPMDFYASLGPQDKIKYWMDAHQLDMDIIAYSRAQSVLTHLNNISHAERNRQRADQASQG